MLLKDAPWVVKLAMTCSNRRNGRELHDETQNAAVALRVCCSMTQLLKEEPLYIILV